MRAAAPAQQQRWLVVPPRSSALSAPACVLAARACRAGHRMRAAAPAQQQRSHALGLRFCGWRTSLTNHWMSSHSAMPSPVCGRGNCASEGSAAASGTAEAAEAKPASRSRGKSAEGAARGAAAAAAARRAWRARSGTPPAARAAPARAARRAAAASARRIAEAGRSGKARSGSAGCRPREARGALEVARRRWGCCWSGSMARKML